MKKIALLIIILVIITGCNSIDDAVFGGARRNAQRIEERHQILMKLYGMRMDPNTTATELATINTYISEIEAQQRHEQQIKALKGIENEIEQINTYNRYGY